MKRFCVTGALMFCALASSATAAPIGYGWHTTTSANPIFYQVDFATGVATALNESGAVPATNSFFGLTWDAPNNRIVAYDLAATPDKIVALDFAALSDMNPLTNPFSALFNSPVATTMNAMETDPATGDIYAQSETNGTLYKVNFGTSTLDLVQTFPGYNPTSLAIHPTTGEFYGMEYSDMNLYQLDLGAGTVTPVFNTGIVNVIALDFDGTGMMYGIRTDGDLIKIDINAPSATTLFSSVLRLDDITIAADQPVTTTTTTTSTTSTTTSTTTTTLIADHHVGYKAKGGPPVPSDFNIQIDDVALANSDPDDPENYTVRTAKGVLNPAMKNLEPGPTQPALHYVRYQLKGSQQGVGTVLPSGNYPKAVRHVRRSWEIDNQFGNLIIESSKVSALLVPTATIPGKKGDTPPVPLVGDDTHYVCYKVKAATIQNTAQAPNNLFRRDLDQFFRVNETVFDDCEGNTFIGGANALLQDKCLYNLKKPKELCNPIVKLDVEAPRITSAPPGMSSTPETDESLLCYQSKLARRAQGIEAATLLGVAQGTTISPGQTKHVSTSILTAISNQFAEPEVLAKTKNSTVCVPSAIVSATPLP